MEPESNYCIQKNPQYVSILSYIYPLHAFQFVCFKIYCNITFLSMWDSHSFSHGFTHTSNWMTK